MTIAIGPTTNPEKLPVEERVRLVIESEGLLIDLLAHTECQPNLVLECLRYLTHLPPGLYVRGALLLTGCEALLEIPQDLRVENTLDLTNCYALRRLPEGLHIKNGDLTLHNCISLKRLPQMYVSDLVVAPGCTALTELSRGIVVGSLDLSCCTALEALPPDLVVKNMLDLRGCTSLRLVPDSIKARIVVLPKHLDKLKSRYAAQ